MSVCAVMLVKDEADIIETTVRHLLANVDHVIVADNMSTDGTLEILQEISLDEPFLTVHIDEEPGYYQSDKTTRLALEAYEERHRWVLPVDADEIWITDDGRPINEFLAGVSRDAVIVKAAIYNHVATALDPPDDDPVRRLGWRQTQHLDIRWGKVACRTSPGLVILPGNHDADTGGTGRTERGLQIRHFPYRSAAQFIRKARNGAAAYKAAPEIDEQTGLHWRQYGLLIEDHGEAAAAEWFRAHFYSDDPGADDTLVLDPCPVFGVPVQGS